MSPSGVWGARSSFCDLRHARWLVQLERDAIHPLVGGFGVEVPAKSLGEIELTRWTVGHHIGREQR
jgi:hypothetical protein